MFPSHMDVSLSHSLPSLSLKSTNISSSEDLKKKNKLCWVNRLNMPQNPVKWRQPAICVCGSPAHHQAVKGTTDSAVSAYK